MIDQESFSERPWPRKFRDAFRGMKAGVRGQSSFFVHFFLTAAVIVAAVVLRVDLTEWCILLICIAMVLTTEMLNSALESMAKAITGQMDPHLGNSLDIGSGAVLVASIGAAIVGSIIFINRLGSALQWW
jgi:diacylglycerol kinase